MRDAFGSTFMFKIIIIFVVFYVSFMTIAVSYARAFRIKNRVIDILEQSQYDGTTSELVNVDDVLEEFSYNYGTNTTASAHCSNNGGYYTANGSCIITNSISSDEAYYTVIIYLVIDLPLFGYTPVIPVYGETETVIIS